MITQLARKSYTPAEYLELEAEAEIRHEFINGEIVAMAGGTTSHNEIVTNLCLLLKPPLRQKRGKVYTENVRLWIPNFKIFTYPDVMVLTGEPIYHGDRKTTVTNPVAIIEVLSDSTRDYDLGRKFGFYRSLDTLEEYVLVEPETRSIMVYRKGNNKNWSLDILENQTDMLELQSIDAEISLSDIYEGVL